MARRHPTSVPSPTGSVWDSAHSASAAATRLPEGWILLAPDPTSADGQAVRGQLRRIPDGMTVPFDEAMR